MSKNKTTCGNKNIYSTPAIVLTYTLVTFHTIFETILFCTVSIFLRYLIKIYTKVRSSGSWGCWMRKGEVGEWGLRILNYS